MKDQARSSLMLFTSSFPHGKGEQFLDSEIVYLSNAFKKVYIIPTHGKGDLRQIPANCEIIQSSVTFLPARRLRSYIVKNLRQIISLYYQLIVSAASRTYYLKNFRSSIAEMAVMIEESQSYHRNLQDYLKDVSAIYFYWFTKPVIHFAILKHLGRINQRLVCRGLGYDYDPAQNASDIFLFRELELTYLDHVLINSNHGANIVSKLYPKFANKISCSYLGLEAHNELTPQNDTVVLHVVSCSFLIPLKRVHLIIESLKYVTVPIKWTHIGEGPLSKELQIQATELPANIQYEFLGYIESVEDYYLKTACDLFITTTSAEGLPFSLMEAIAAGIPLIGTAVGGVPEIVNSRTGYLIPKDFECTFLAEIITAHSLLSKSEKSSLKNSARMFFDETFTSRKNISHFIQSYLN